jgi:flagella basal body P-ring formation protein FlgA
MGADAEVGIEQVGRVQQPQAAVEDAVLDPGAKLGVPTRFLFRGRRPQGGQGLAPIGGATVVLRVTIDHAHTTRAVRRGEVLTAADVVTARHALERGPLRPLPTLEDASDARVLRDLPGDACLTASVMVPEPVVRKGAEVVAVMRSAGVEVRAQVVAADSGQRGALIRVVNPESRRTFRARIVSRGLVEIRQ